MCDTVLDMIADTKNGRRLTQIIVYGFSFAFGIVFASLEALRPIPEGFSIELSWRTLLTLVIGTGVMLPCFQIITFSEQNHRRRMALVLVALLGIAAFFYPLRFVPREKMAAVFTGLGAAVIALFIVAGLLLLLLRFFEREEKRKQS